jgi:hypothetical protein
MKKAGLILLTVIYFSCGDLTTEPDWSNYDSNLKSIIDNSDCEGLKLQFDNAEANSDNQRARTGAGNSLLMSYIDSKMQEKNCY